MDAIKNKILQVINPASGNGKTVLVTGYVEFRTLSTRILQAEPSVSTAKGSGFVAAHVLNSFLSRGYNVRTTVRSEQTAEKVKKAHRKYLDRLSFAIVPDVATPGGHDEAVKDVDGVIHTASPFVLQVEDNERDLLRPAIDSTTSVLTSIQKHNPKVKRVVITSSFAAIVGLDQGVRPGYTYSEKDWNPVTYETASSQETSGVVAYCASKTFAEQAAFDFVAKSKPNFSVSTICPPMIWGPTAHTVGSLEHLNTSSADIYSLMNGSKKAVPDTGIPAWVDVRDVAAAHLKAYESSEAAGQRYFTTAGRYTYNQICEIMLKNFSELKGRVPEPKVEDFPDVYDVSNEKSKKELGIDFIDLETSIVDQVKDFLALEKRSKA